MKLLMVPLLLAGALASGCGAERGKMFSLVKPDEMCLEQRHRLPTEPRLLQPMVRQWLLRAARTMSRTSLAIAVVTLASGGCASIDPQLHAPDARVVREYSAVRDGAAERTTGRGYRFARAGEGVIVTRVMPLLPGYEEPAVFEDAIAVGVRRQLDEDPALATSAIAASVDRYVVHLNGVAEDESGARAIYDALALPGVNAVYAQFDRPGQ